MRKLYKIGPLQLDPQARLLTHDGAAVALGARGVAVLAALVSRANECVQKLALLDAAWPDLVVEEANLAVQISAIRRVLARVPGGERWIETLARRGYRFVGPVVELADRAGPPKAVDRKRTNLPELMTSFVGRERELAEIKQLLPKERLLTLAGPGGIGKTRLAQQVAAEVLDAYRDGVWFVDLAPLVEPVLVPSALAQVLQVKESAGNTLVRSLCDHLRAREVLLILDNCEQVLDACARLAETLLRESVRVTMIATSREPLHLVSEHIYSLAALPLPDPDASLQSIARSDAVQLFVERARQYRRRFDLQDQRARAVAEICVRLDGIPLALELAAARIAVLPVEQIARLLDQRFRLLISGNRELPRHQTLRAMIDWSYELLDDAEKTLFARLSVFAGGWTLAAAETVCGGEPIGKDEAVYVLIGLIEQSLVIADEDGDRYHLLETLREYAKEKLVVSSDSDAVRRRHRDYFLALAEEADPKIYLGAEQPEWLHRLDEEHENFRLALESSVARGELGASFRLCGALKRFWFMRGHLSEGRRWCMLALGMAGGEEQTLERAKTLDSAGTLAHYQADYPAARALHEESLFIRRQLGDRRAMASSMNNLGNVIYAQGDYSSASALHKESLAIWRELGDRRGVASSLVNLGNLASSQLDSGSARALYNEGLAIMRDLGNRGGIANVLYNLGNIAYAQEDYPAARALYEECLPIRQALGDRLGIADTLHMLGEVSFEQGDLQSAAGLYREGLAIVRELGQRGRLSSSLAGLAAIVAGLGNPLRAARIWGAAERLREEIGSPLSPRSRPRYDRRIDAARAAAGDAVAFDRAREDGRALSLERAIDTALTDSDALR